MEYEGLIVVQIGDTKRKPAFHSVLEFMPVAGFKIHEKEIALSTKYVIDVIPVIRIVERIAGVTTR